MTLARGTVVDMRESWARIYRIISGGALPSVFVIPLTIRLHRYSSVLAAAFQLLWSIFRPVATVHMLTLGLIFILWNPRSIVRMRDSSLIAFFALPVPISLFVTFHEMWLVTGNGNPNYLFFQCFAYGLFVAVILLDVVSATVKSITTHNWSLHPLFASFISLILHLCNNISNISRI